MNSAKDKERLLLLIDDLTMLTSDETEYLKDLISKDRLGYPMRIDFNYRYNTTYFNPPTGQGPFYCVKFSLEVRSTPAWTDVEVLAEIGNTQWPGLIIIISIFNSSLNIGGILTALNMINTWLINIINIQTIESTNAHH